MPANVDSVSATAERLIKLAGVVALAYIVVMGLSYRAGIRLGHTKGQQRRERDGKPNLKRLSEEDRWTPFWKDEALIEGGLKGIQVIAIFCLYVVIMLAVFPPAPAELPAAISSLLTYPNSMEGLGVLLLTLGLAGNAGLRLWLFALLSVAAAAGTWVIFSRMRSGLASMGFQLFILTLQSLLISHVTGVFAGIQSANFEQRFPLVDVITIEGRKIGGLRMLKSADTECRFIEPEGEECLMPKTQIQVVRAKVPKPEK